MKKKTVDLANILIILLCVAIFFTPLFTPGILDGSDGLFHVGRIASLADGLRHGIFPPKLRPVLMFTYGYGVGFMYPDFFLYFPAILMLCGASAELTYKAYIMAVLLFGGVGNYFLFKKITKYCPLATLGSVLLISSSILRAQIYEGGAISSATALMFLPMAFCGLTWALKGEEKGAKLFAIGILGALLSHHITFLLLMICSFLLVVFNLHKIIKKPVIIWNLFKYCLVSMFVSTAYWLPFMEQIVHDKYMFMYANIFSAQDGVVSFSDINFLMGKYLIYAFAVAVVIYVCFIIIKREKTEYLGHVLVGVLLVFIMCSEAFWKGPMGALLANIQNGSRFVPVITALWVVTIVFTGNVVIDAVDDKVSQKLGKIVPVLAFAACLIFTLICNQKVIKKIVTDDFGEKTFTSSDYVIYERRGMGGGMEMLPIDCWYENATEPNTAHSDDNDSADGVKLENGKYYDVWLFLDKKYYDVPYIYYYGYCAYLLDDAGNPVEELEVGKSVESNGYLRVYMPKDKEGIGHILVTYRKTAIQILSYAVTALMVLIVAACEIIGNILRKKI